MLDTQLTQQLAELRRSWTPSRHRCRTAPNSCNRHAIPCTTLQQELPADCRTLATLEQALTTLQQQQQAAQQQLQNAEQAALAAQRAAQEASTLLHSATEQREQATSAWQQADTDWQQALAASPFADEAAYQAACLNPQQQQALETTIQAQLQALQTAQAVLSERQAATAGHTPPDLEALQQAKQAAEQQLQQAEHDLQQAQARLHELQQVARQHAKHQQRLDELEEHYQVIGTLAELATGRNPLRLSLQRFVLGVLLDDVLLAASARFYQMSKGRYELRRKDTRNKGNRAGGLDLLVSDAYTGKEREAATLSGGESFMAALSLALGLSDVIQGYAGGIRLDTLFIDEGFGSLDEQALELAIRTLTELRDSGRLVGVISHVSELRNQIPQQLQVIAEPEGSRVRLRGC
ncbi:MAG: SbcC/MukB-like Walker B domain-containing protein [Thiolinea sp.]